MRIKYTIAIVAILALTAQTAAAASSKEENVGVGTGAVVGALAGGPFGLIIGAAFGAKIGDSIHQKSESIDTLQGSLQNSERSVARLERGVDELNAEVAHLQGIARPELVKIGRASCRERV